ncbi:sensor histidine kinase [Salinibacterium sp. NK8237]|uniref:ATP-binding protein n=1 Tax=Salinibacterium sp. NK8237 TaxID=2792038 RepID=UPI0018CCF5C8|nr:sensor histidine kinase [Salinibacterium sp. NK8237]MBH0131575.1 sensor histidine kinase [Salinibacterium sp. NK8237]
MKLRTQLLLLQLAIVLVAVLGTGFVAGWLQEQQLRDSYRDRMIAVAQSVATLPAIISALDSDQPSETVQPIAEVVREASDVTYVVVVDSDGIRLSHPTPALIGEQVSTDPSDVLAGEIYVGTQTGTLGESWRVKVPIFDGDRIVGAVSVGILESNLRTDYLGNSVVLFVTIGVAAVFGVVGAAWVTSVIRRRIYGLEPDEIVGLLEAREAMLHGLREGLVALDEHGRIALINDSGADLLGLDDPHGVVGHPAIDVLSDELVRMLDDDGSRQRLVLVGERVLLVQCDVALIDDRLLGSVFILRDNTKLHALMRDLDGANDLADGLRVQAHGFANKLHVISGLLELGHVSEAVSFIERVGDGGTLSSVTNGSGIRDLEIAALLLVKQMRAHESGINLELDSSSALSPLATHSRGEGARDDLLTVLGNLVDNATEACSPGARVRVRILETFHSFEIEVSDDGPGIPEKLRSKVFSPGFSTKGPPPGVVTATRGIGLTLVERIAHRHGGEALLATSPTLGGTTIIVRLPFAETARQTNAKEAEVLL